MALLALNFSRLLPNVSQVVVENYAFMIATGPIAVSPECIAVKEEVVGNAASSAIITQLHITGWDAGSCGPLLGAVFKNVKTLEAHYFKDIQSHLWKAWRETLEEMSLNVSLTAAEGMTNFDAVFCGYPPGRSQASAGNG